MQCELLLSHRGLIGEFKKDWISLFLSLVLLPFFTYLLLTYWRLYQLARSVRISCEISVIFRVKNFVSTWLGQFQPLHNRIAMFDITCVLRLFAFRSDPLHWLCTSKLIFKRHVLSSVWFRGCSIWEQHLPPSMTHTCISCRVCDWSWSSTPVSGIKGVSQLQYRMARHANLYVQSIDFHNTDSCVPRLRV
jgi:hypothetical protein